MESTPCSQSSLPAKKSGIQPLDFRKRFCEQRNCSPESFELQLLWKVLPLRALLFARLLSALKPGFFAHDLKMLDYAGDAISISEVTKEANEMRNDAIYSRRLLRRLLGLRISGRKLLQIARATFPPPR